MRRLGRFLAIGLTLAAQGCSTLDNLVSPPAIPEGQPGFVTGFLGGVVAEEPRAALIGREVLSTGGTAADAAAAIGLALAVTLPSRASLGGGGACLVWDSARNEAQGLEFRAPAPPPGSIGPGVDRPAAIPMAARGLFALQARWGRQSFERVLAPAEQLARIGTPVSRALARDLQVVATPLFADPLARQMFAGPTGSPLVEGEILLQPELGGFLGLVRARGVGDLHQGQIARLLADTAPAAGAVLPTEALRAALPRLVEPVRREVGNDQLFALPGEGAAALEAFAALQEGSLRGADPTARERLLADASSRARGAVEQARGRSLPAALPASTGFAVLDRFGLAVACSLTMNNLFGTGRVLPSTGLVLAAAPGVGQVVEPIPSILLASNRSVRAFRGAYVASGQADAPAGVAIAAARDLLGREALADSVASGGPAARVGAIHCPGYLPNANTTCRWATDPRGAGLAIGAQ